MRRLFWLGLGVAAGVTLSRKMRETARQASPAGLASNLGEAVRELASALGTFGAEVRAGMNEREQELHEMVEQRSGLGVDRAGYGDRFSAEADGRHAAQSFAPRTARARRAEG